MATDTIAGTAGDPTGAGTAGEAERRARAFEESAWGERFHLFQPRNLCFWVLVWLGFGGAHRLVTMYSGPFGYYSHAFTAAALVGLVSALAWAWWFRRLDRYERQPLGLLVTAFLWGGLAAAFAISIAGNDAIMTLYDKVFGQAWASDWQAGLSAPFVEETSKGVGLLLLVGLAPRLVRTVNDGLIIGCFLGLGFQTFEDFLYAANAAQAGFGTSQIEGVTGGILTRTISDLVSHPLFTALFCAGLVLVIGTAAQPRRLGAGIALLVAPVAIHGVWDSAIALGDGTWAPFVELADATFAFTVLWLAFRLARPREQAFVRDILAPEVTRGSLEADELDALTDDAARKAYVHAGGRHRRDRRRRKHVLRAALDLCHDLAVAKGHDTPEVAEARVELARHRAAATAA